MKNKWRHIRDNLARYIHQLKKGNPAAKKRKYIYADALSFLNKTFESRKTRYVRIIISTYTFMTWSFQFIWNPMSSISFFFELDYLPLALLAPSHGPNVQQYKRRNLRIYSIVRLRRFHDVSDFLSKKMFNCSRISSSVWALFIRFLSP